MADLVDIAPPDYDISRQIAYATEDNFTGAPIYSRPGCYLVPEAAARLAEAAGLAAGQGFRLRIYDAFRPSEAQWALWRHTPDPNYISDPRKGSPHTRGVAVDLTLEDRENGKILEMGTPFDDFTTASHHGAPNIPSDAAHNRYLLLGLMTTAGWELYRNEWWHYQLPEAARWPLLGDDALDEPMMAT